MLELPVKFKQALGNGVRTSLYPLVRIYKGYQIDDTIPDDVEAINLSIKETSIKNLDNTYEGYIPLLLNSPSISSKADIINNKYTISSVSLSISNAPYNGKIFSDDIPSLLNAVVQVYYAANGLDSLDDCLLVYTGTIRRYSQSAETLSLTLEDLTEQKLKTQIPSTTIQDKEKYKESDIGKPYPMVYGLVDKSPLITTLEQTLEIDKPNRNIKDYWNGASQIDYGNEAIQNSSYHPLRRFNYLRNLSYLSIYEGGFIPIYQEGVRQFGSRIYNNYNEDVSLYSLINNESEPAHIKFNFDSFIHEKWDEEANEGVGKQGIPARIYRPIDKVSFFALNLPNIDGDLPNTNKFVGYQNQATYGPMRQIIQSYSDNIESQNLYNEFWNDGPTEGDVLNYWEPTSINENLEGEEEIVSHYDDNWYEFYDESYKAAEFDVSWIQNWNQFSGLNITCINESGEGGGAYARLFFKQNVGSLPCVTKIFYNIEYFPAKGRDYPLGTDTNPTAFWVEKQLVERTGIYLDVEGSDVDPEQGGDWEKNRTNPEDWVTPCWVPNKEHNFEIDNFDEDGYGQWHFVVRYQNQNEQQNGAHDILNTADYENIIEGFDTTNAYNSIQWGSPKIKHCWYNNFLIFNSCIANLKDFYVLQDALILDYANKDFYGAIAGRTSLSNDLEIISKAEGIMKDILQDELLYNGNIDESQADVQIDLDTGINSWQYSFTLNEQKETKEVMEDMFKATLLIPSFDSAGQFKFIGIKQIISSYDDVISIDTEDIIKYSFELTKLDDVYNSVNVKYKKNYGSGEYDKQTGYTIADTTYTTLDEYTTTELGYSGNDAYDIGYYGLDSEDAKLEIETDYIRAEFTAVRLQKKLLLWHCNQHLITKIDLPAHYMHLEAGDYIRFNDLLGGKLAFGYDYSKVEHRNGQLIYPVFFITKVSKSLSKVTIEGVQVHRGEYGFPLDDDNDAGDTVNGNGEDVTENNQLPDPQDDPNYNEDSIGTDEFEFEEDNYLRIQMGSNRNLNTNQVVCFVSTNMDESWEYNIWVRAISSSFEYNGIEYNSGEYEVGDLSGMDLVNHALSMQDNDGYITIEKKFELYPQGAVIEFILEVKNTQFTLEESFDQLGINESETEELIGDVTGDGVVNVLDVVLLVNMALGFEEPNDEADINNDGIINVLDMVQLVAIILE